MTLLIIGVLAAVWAVIVVVAIALCLSAAQGEAALEDELGEPLTASSLLDRTGHLATTRFSVPADAAPGQRTSAA
ncbi:MAG TPA: hypothetical protein VN238_11185 [Solirubrobacteraceae bacterium]|nr:hypothetical protein [Solirubrobacteraceae bacterium]